MVVFAVLFRHFRQCFGSGRSEMIARQRLDEHRAPGVDDHVAFAVAAFEGGANLFDTVHDFAGPEPDVNAGLSQFFGRAAAGGLLFRDARRVAKGRLHACFAPGRPDLDRGRMFDGPFAADRVFINNAKDPVAADLYPQAHKRIANAEIDRAVQRQHGVVADGGNMHRRVKVGKDRVFHIRPDAKHLALKPDLAAAPHLGNRVIDGKITVAVAGLAGAIAVQRAAAARAVRRALLNGLPQAPAKHRHAAFGSVIDQLLHQPVGAVHRAEHLHRRQLAVACVRDILGRVEDLLVEKLDLIAPQFVNMPPADRHHRLRQHLYARAVAEPALALEHRPGKKCTKRLLHKPAQVFVRAARLVQRPGQNPRIAARLKQSLQQRRDCRELRLAPAAIGPNNAIAVRPRSASVAPAVNDMRILPVTLSGGTVKLRLAVVFFS